MKANADPFNMTSLNSGLINHRCINLQKVRLLLLNHQSYYFVTVNRF